MAVSWLASYEFKWVAYFQITGGPERDIGEVEGFIMSQELFDEMNSLIEKFSNTLNGLSFGIGAEVLIDQSQSEYLEYKKRGDRWCLMIRAGDKYVEIEKASLDQRLIALSKFNALIDGILIFQNLRDEEIRASIDKGLSALKRLDSLR